MSVSDESTSALSDITCPGCGTPARLDAGLRDSTSFCRVCDYPLFWARERVQVAVGASATDASLRRLPGTAGRTAIANIICPVCAEPNQPLAKLCQRCGSDLHPAPVAPAPVAPPPVILEPVIVEYQRRWPWIVLGIALLLAVVALIVLLAVYD